LAIYILDGYTLTIFFKRDLDLIIISWCNRLHRSKV
jgi:hypothetical protein